MRTRLPGIAFRLLVLTLVWLLGTSTLSLAQEPVTQTTTATAGQPAQPPDTAAQVLVVPDVRGLPYVFAKGILEDVGFAWKVEGKVEGYAVNLVDEQSVKPGTRLVDTGAPRLDLMLRSNPDYPERGLPEAASPYAGTDVVLASGAAPKTATDEPAGASADTTATDTTPTETTATDTTTDTTDPETAETTTATDATGATTTDASSATTDTTAADATVTSADPAAEAAAAATTAGATKPGKPGSPRKRPPAFAVRGVPKEPLDEIPLPLRAKRLGERMHREPSLTGALADFYTYQHAWVVAGARFGWWHGAEALRLLIGVDNEVQKRFGVGYESEAIARAALVEVLAKSK